MNEFDAELKNLLRDEYESRPYTVESLEEERQELLEVFYDHVEAVHGFHLSELSVESMNATEPREVLRPVDYDNINEQIMDRMKEEQKALWTMEGEKCISGHGLYLCLHGDDPLCLLDDSHVLIGDSARPAVTQIVPYTEYLRIRNNNFPEPGDDYQGETATGLHILLENTKRYDGAGNLIAEHGDVLVPLTYESFKVAAVVRQPFVSVEYGEDTRDSESTHALLAADRFKENCTDIENDLTYNDYSAEDFAVQYQQHIDELREQVNHIDRETPMMISGIAERLTHEAVVLSQANAYYDGPTIIRIGDAWRVVHGFSVDNEPVHILPENLTEAEVDNE